MNEISPELVLFFGRFHPLLVHLPIGFIFLLVVLEVLACLPRLQHLRCARGPVLALAVPAAALTVICGWLLSHSGGYDAYLLDWHLWLGLGVAGACLLALILHELKWQTAYDVMLAVTFFGMLAASHFGGSLTHGSDYLTHYLPALLREAGVATGENPAVSVPVVQAGDVGKDAAFATLVQPVLNAKCVACHNPDKAKAGLRLDNLEAVLKGGKGGPVVVPGDAAASGLVKRLLLPAGHDDHMPPEGKPQLSGDEIALMQWWIDAGAAGDKSPADLKLPANLQHFVAVKEPAKPVVAAAVPMPAKPLAEVLPVAARLADELGISLLPLAQNEPWLQGNASIAGKNFDDAGLTRLGPVAANLRWLDLTCTGVTDQGLVQVARMRHLKRLHLARTAITDDGVRQLAALDELESLNLHGTPVTNATLDILRPMRQLRHLYVWQTAITAEAVKGFAERSMDKDQIQRWQAEITALTAKIKSQGVTVEAGEPEGAGSNNEPEKPPAKP